MRFLQFLRSWKRKVSKTSDTFLEIRIKKERLVENLNFFKSLFPYCQIAVVLKSNAYGHGLKEIGTFLDKREEVSYLVVDSLLEALILRDAGVKKGLLILGNVLENNLFLLKKIKKATLLINSLTNAKLFSSKINFPLSVHLKVDTGMRRQGVKLEELAEAIRILSLNKNLKIEGLATHLADADNVDEKETLKQIQLWKEALKIFKSLVKEEGIFHFSATAGTKFLSPSLGNLIRLGIGFYGIDTTFDSRLKVKPALSFWARVINFKEIKRGEGIGYNFSWRADENGWIGILPCGYYEGLPWALSNKGVVYFENQPLKIRGRISMNMTAIEITPVINQIKENDWIEVYSDEVEKLNSVQKIAQACNTLPYEILVRLAPTIRRVLI
ncbi:MAG: alanine racemase [Patescibacteria group bacterium]|nr:alanine racemase [Patescibacteria group bacterium]